MMRRALSIALLAMLLLSGCVQVATTAQSGAPGVAAQTDALQSERTALPMPQPATPAAPTPAVPTQTAPTPAAVTPAAPGLAPQSPDEKPMPPGEVVAQGMPPMEKRLYLDEQPGFTADMAYTFEGGAYTEQDLKLLCVFLNLKQWGGLQAVVGAFGSALSPDIRLCDFVEEDAYVPAPIISAEPTYYEGAAAIYIAYGGDTYALVFRQKDDGRFSAALLAYVYTDPIHINREGERYQPQARVETIGDERFYVITYVQSDGAAKYINREHWYSMTDGKLKMRLANNSVFFDSVVEGEQITLLDVEKAKTNAEGFYIPCSSSIRITLFDLQGMEAYLLETENPFTLYYTYDGKRMFADASRNGFYADTGVVYGGQLKYVLGGQLQEMAASRVRGAAAMAQFIRALEDYDWDAPKMPQNKIYINVGKDAVKLVDFDGARSKPLTKAALYALADEIRGRDEDATLSALLSAYGVRPIAQPEAGPQTEEEETQDEGAAAPLETDIAPGSVREFFCTLDFHTAFERQAYLSLTYRKGGKRHGILVLFTLSRDAYLPCAAYGYAYNADGEDAPFAKYYRGLGEWTYPLAGESGQPQRHSIYFWEGAYLACYYTAVTGQNGMRYELVLSAKPDGTGVIYIRAFMRDESDEPVMDYRLPVWRDDTGLFIADEYDLLLLSGQMEEHEGFMRQLGETLAAAREEERELQEPQALPEGIEEEREG
ncbi:MAG: hypothetical protein LBS18_06430 [Clostridiales bacterium]|nr:hypothetical protein [Clostridiales bacterium]